MNRMTFTAFFDDLTEQNFNVLDDEMTFLSGS